MNKQAKSLLIFSILLLIISVTAICFVLAATTIDSSEPNPDLFFGNTIPTISATTNDSADCMFGIPSTAIGPVELPTNGTTSHSVSDVDISGIADGDYNVSIFCMNSSDATDNSSLMIAFTKDTTSPTFVRTWQYDTDIDGNIDEIVIELNESISDATTDWNDFSLSSGSIAGIGANDGTTANGKDPDVANDKYFTLEVSVTGTAPVTVSYTQDTLADSAGNLVDTNAAIANLLCGDTITTSTTLTDDLDCSGNGIFIGASDIILDCAGHSITGDGSPGNGIDNAGYDNVTVKNCIISGFNNASSSNYNTGIHYYNEANNGSIINNIVNSNLEGIFLNSSSGNNITDNIANDNAYQGILLIGSNNNTITNNIAINSTTGIYLGSTSGCNYNTITYNNISNSSQNGISLDTDSNDNIIENNRVSYSSNVGIGLWSGSSNNNISFNQIYNNTNNEVYQQSSSNNNFTLNYLGGYICNVKAGGISLNELMPYYTDEAMTTLDSDPLDCMCDTTIMNNITIHHDQTCTGSGATIGVSDITIDCDGHSITGPEGSSGIYIESQSNIIIKNCYLSEFAAGINIKNSDSITLQNNTLDSNAGAGIYIDGAGIVSYHTIINNTITNNCWDYSSNCGAIYLKNEDNCLIQGNDIHDNSVQGILLVTSNNNQILSNNIYYNGWGGIIITSPTSAVNGGYNNVSGNTLVDNGRIGIATKTEGNSFTDNNISTDEEGTYLYGIDLRRTGSVYPENTYLSGNNVSGYQYGLDVWSGVMNFTMDGDSYHNNDYGVYLYGVGSGGVMPTIMNAEIYNNINEGMSLVSFSTANITNTNFNNNGNVETGLYVDSSSLAYVENGNFTGNGQYGILDAGPLEHVLWTISGKASCKNNDIQIETGGQNITFNGGTLELENCLLTIDGAELNITGNLTSLDFKQETVDENVSTDFVFNETADANTTITLNLNDTISTTISVSATNLTSAPEGFDLNSVVTGIDIFIDDTTRGALTWAMINISYNETAVLAAGLDENNLVIYFYNATAGEWQLEPDQDVNTDENYVWANVTHFSIFGIFGSASTSEHHHEETTTGGVLGETYALSDSQLESGIIESLASGGKVTFNINGMSHSVTVLSLTATTATIEVASTPQEATLVIGQEAQFDVTGDNIADISVTLNSITDNKASITIKKLAGAAAAGITPPANVTGGKGNETGGVEGPINIKMMWILGMIGIVVVILIAIGITAGKKKKINREQRRKTTKDL